MPFNEGKTISSDNERPQHPRLKISGSGIRMQLDKSSTLKIGGSVKVDGGKLKIKRFGIEYKKEF